jgi:transmembrane 9 superfamily protein 3
MRADEEDGAPEEETGWKLVHGDVFRCVDAALSTPLRSAARSAARRCVLLRSVPGNANLLSAFIGAGAHLFVTTIATLSLAVCGAFSAHRRGSILTAVIVLYALTAGVGGYVH